MLCSNAHAKHIGRHEAQSSNQAMSGKRPVVCFEANDEIKQWVAHIQGIDGPFLAVSMPVFEIQFGIEIRALNQGSLESSPRD